MHNPDVAQLQTFLVAEGYSIPDAVTNYFGPETFAAVKAFQKANGLPVTGYVGPLTRAILNKGIIATTPEAGH
jgi:peptidoglycan hydrolase-like protein with peptidoglycan-binding domain